MESAAERQDAGIYGRLTELMARRRTLTNRSADTSRGNATNARIADEQELQLALARLHAHPRGETPRHRSNALKHELLAQLRNLTGGEACELAAPVLDAIELIGSMLEQVLRELRPNSPAIPIVERLQLPLLGVVLTDESFFTRRHHPARQVINALAEAGEFLNPEISADRLILERMRLLVDRANKHFDGNPVFFSGMLADLNLHLQAQGRRAEVAERRHVEAARGKEKLESAQIRAAETLDRLLDGQRIPRFMRTLLGQAWSDVLALTLLRHGDDSDTYRQQLQIAERLIQAAVEQRSSGDSPIDVLEAQGLREAIAGALAQVGCHADDAHELAARLLVFADDQDDAATSTELATRLKQRVRFGQQLGDAASEQPDPVLDASGQAELERIVTLPMGTWFEFLDDETGNERRRLSWFSIETSRCLFLNHHGQRIDECSLQWLAAEVAGGKAGIVFQKPGTLVERAWQVIIDALQSLATTSESE